MRENWPVLLLLVGIMAGRQAGRQADEIQVSFKIFKILYRLKLFRLLICLISLQCYYSIRSAFQLALSSIAYLKVCFEVRKIWLPFFSCQSLLLGTGVPNDITSEERICKLELFVMLCT